MTAPGNGGQPPAGYDIPQLPPPHVEATASANCHLTIEGHQVQVTVRTGVTTQDVEVVIGTMAGVIRAYATPAPTVTQIPTVQPTPYPPPGLPPPPPAAPPPPNGSEAVPYCFEHGEYFIRHQRDGQIWYSHKIKNPLPGGKTWCRYQPPVQA